jgi:hypothetical protein
VTFMAGAVVAALALVALVFLPERPLQTTRR